MSGRISERMRFGTTANRIAQVRLTADDIQETAISGRRLRNLSTDPVSAVRVLRNRNKLENAQQFKRTIDYAKGYMQKTEDALRGIGDALIRAKELAVQQVNGTWDAQTREIVSAEVRNLGDQVVQLGNSTYGDKYVFGGFRNGTPPIAPDGTFGGDDGLMFLQVDEDSFRPVNVSGREVFDSPPEHEDTKPNLVTTLRGMYLALQNNDVDGIRKAMVRIDEVTNSVIKNTALLGSRQLAVDDVAFRLERSEEMMQSDNNKLEGADPISSAMDLKRAEGAMNFTLKSSSDILAPTLLQFLK